MIIDISKEGRTEAIASIQRYFQENLPEPIGDLPAGLLLNFFLEEIGPAIYNRTIADAQARLQLRISDLSGDSMLMSFSTGREWKKSARTGGDCPLCSHSGGEDEECVALR